jgi:hypothetical protein
MKGMFLPLLDEVAAFSGFGKGEAGESFCEGTNLTVPFENPSL